MTCEAAVTKMAYLLSLHLSPQDLRVAFQTSLRGELTESLDAGSVLRRKVQSSKLEGVVQGGLRGVVLAPSVGWAFVLRKVLRYRACDCRWWWGWLHPHYWAAAVRCEAKCWGFGVQYLCEL